MIFQMEEWSWISSPPCFLVSHLTCHMAMFWGATKSDPIRRIVLTNINAVIKGDWKPFHIVILQIWTRATSQATWYLGIPVRDQKLTLETETEFQGPRRRQERVSWVQGVLASDRPHGSKVAKILKTPPPRIQWLSANCKRLPSQWSRAGLH